jgi:hypothetical protein
MRKSKPNTMKNAPKKRSETANKRIGIGTGAETASTNTAADATDHGQNLTITMTGIGANGGIASTIGTKRKTGEATASGPSHGQGLHTAEASATMTDGAHARPAAEIEKIETATDSAITHLHDAHTISPAVPRKKSAHTDHAHLPRS